MAWRGWRWYSAGMVHLLPATDQHFAWFLKEASAPVGLREPVGVVDDPIVLKILRRLTATLHAAGRHESWLIVDEDEVVGLCGCKRPPDATGAAEIGYGVAATRRHQGYATSAVQLIINELLRTSGVTRLLAETAVGNVPSQRVLERNGFLVEGRRHDAEDGELIIWSRPLTLQPSQRQY